MFKTPQRREAGRRRKRIAQMIAHAKAAGHGTSHMNEHALREQMELDKSWVNVDAEILQVRTWRCAHLERANAWPRFSLRPGAIFSRSLIPSSHAMSFLPTPLLTRTRPGTACRSQA